MLVTDNSDRIIGIGAVERGWWWGLWGGLATDRKRSWVAFAPVEESALDSVRVYASVGGGLCAVSRPNTTGGARIEGK